MKRYKKIGPVVGFIVLLVFLLNLNHIILFFCSKDILISKTDFKKYNLTNRVYVYMNPFEYLEDDLTESVFCSGWAFAETTKDNSDKTIQLILKGQKNTFITKECGLLADDIHRRIGWKTIPGQNNNFAVQFSTITLPADIYEIYVYVCENDEVQGVANTGQSFRKEGVFLYDYPTGEICENININSITNEIDYGWITVTSINDCIRVSGWCAVDSLIAENANYFLHFAGNNQNAVTLQVANYCRSDVADYLENNDYMMSGFSGGLRKELLPDEKGTVYVIIEYEGNFYISQSEIYDVTSDS